MASLKDKMNEFEPVALDAHYSPIARGGLKIIGIFIAFAVVFAWIHPLLGILGGMLLGWVMWFFRDPKRIVPEQKNLITACSDGRVIAIEDDIMPFTEDTPAKRISVFLNIFDVHVLRSPVSGIIVNEKYTPGNFFNAALDKAHQENERHTFVCEMDDETQIAYTFVAGVVARRIKPYIRQGDAIAKGERTGLIRFGSRVDLYLPENVEVEVVLGQSTISGETVLAKFVEAKKPVKKDSVKKAETKTTAEKTVKSTTKKAAVKKAAPKKAVKKEEAKAE